MNDVLTKTDIAKMQEELDQLRRQWPEIVEEVQRTRAFGDLSENYEYKAAKQAMNHSRSRQRYLEKMITTAVVIEDRSSQEEVGLFDQVVLYLPEDDEEQTVSVVTTIRVDPLHGLISRESPCGRAILGKKVGDHALVQVNDNCSYEVVIRKIEKGRDDGSAPILRY